MLNHFIQQYVYLSIAKASTMKKLILLPVFFFWIFGIYAQTFFEHDFAPNKRYVILCDPTVSRITTIEYLTENNIFKINKKKVEFVGVYFEGQNYDFAKTKQYIEENHLSNFHLQEIKGELDETNLYRENQISSQLKNVFEHSVGIIFFGGPDIPPSVYGEENTRSVVTDPGRHFYEASFMFQLLGGSQNENFEPFLAGRPDYVVTGFCLGMQTMNVATGGTLVQDIPEEIYDDLNAEETVKNERNNLHRNYWQEIVNDSLLMEINLHPVRFTANPFFGKVIKLEKLSTPRVLSSHHQAAEKLGKNLEVTAVSMDGLVVEGLAHKVYPNVFAVQFHPEVPALYEDMNSLKFAPGDQPDSYNNIIGKESVRFHKKYWKHISKAFKSVH